MHGVLLILLPILFIVGAISKISGLSGERRRNDYYQMFEEMNFKSTNGDYPIFLGEHDEQLLKRIVFQSQIPLKNWINKKDLLEAHLNTKIADIKLDSKNNNVIHIMTIVKSLPELLEWDDDCIFRSDNVLSLGLSYESVVTINLSRSPHCFVAGETGSGKSNILKCLIYQCLKKDHIVKLIDFKRGVSFSDFSENIEIYSDYDDIIIVLEQLVKETNRRLDLLVKHKFEDIEQYNLSVSFDEEIRRIVVFIDELAELMRAGDKQTNKVITNHLETLTRLSRSAGINLIMGIQRPDSTIINGQIKSNVSMRICGRFVDPEPSRIMLGNDRATELQNIKGRFILKDDETTEFQAFYITKEIMSYLPKLKEVEEVKADTYEVQTDDEATEEVTEIVSNQISFNFDDIEI